MRVLFLTFQFPYPPINGAAIKSLSLLEYLGRRHEVRCVSLRRGLLSDEQERWAASVGGVSTVDLNKPRNLWTLLRSYAARVPLRIERNRSLAMARLFGRQTRRFRPEVIFCDGLSMAQYVRYAEERVPSIKLLHEHNAEHLIWQRQAEIETGPRRWVAAREAARLRRYEAAALGRFDVVFAVSEDDRRQLIGLGANPGLVRVLPSIPDPALLELPAPAFADTRPAILYFGTLSWQPNIEGLERLLAVIFPEVRRQMPEARLIVAGTGASANLAARVSATAGAEFIGKVRDPEALYQRARVLVEATRSGGGTRLKVLNAMARGIPVVVSPVAAEGLEIVRGEHLLVADADREMAGEIVRVLSDSGLWRRLSENARRLIRSRYVAEVAYRALDEALAPAEARAG